MEEKENQQLKEILKRLNELKKIHWIILEELVSNPDQAIKLRNFLRAIYGKEITVPFYISNIEAGDEAYSISKEIPYRFSVEKVSANGVPGLKFYYFVSEDNQSTPTGENLLSKFSDNPFLMGSGYITEALTNLEEFKEGKYLKVLVKNTGANSVSDVFAKITIRIYPIR